MAEVNLVVRDGANSYLILNPIGTWGPGFTLTVYEAAVNVLDSPHVAFKMIPQEQGSYINAIRDINRSHQLRHVNRHILPHIHSFHAVINGLRTFCIVLPFDSQVSSLRSVLSRFSQGIPENFIAAALFGALSGLKTIHENENRHMKISAGNIFYNHQYRIIQLAYRASVYERTPTQNDDQEFLVDKMLAWGLAPEVRNEDDDSLEFVEYDTEKSDIWLIGLVALELAYGKIQVANRKELLGIGGYISEMERLPNTWEELRSKSAEFLVEMEMPPWKRRRIDSAPVKMEESRFSERFGSFVANCLVIDPNDRSPAEVLINHVFLQKNVASMENFRDVIVKGLNPHVARVLARKLERGAVAQKLDKLTVPCVIRHNGCTCTVLKLIGKWGPQYGLKVYEAEVREKQFHPTLRIALKMIGSRHDYYQRAVEDAEASMNIVWQFILPLSKYFYRHVKENITLCMVLQFDPQAMSLRSILSSYKFSTGIPKDCISLALRCAVAGLAELHSIPKYHTQITAGNIFYCFQDQTIKLGFAGSAYERTFRRVSEELVWSPVNEMLSWGLAPEIEIENYAPLEYVHVYMTAEPDIWLVGIVALELAYGRIHVWNREELLGIARYIRNTRRLPNSWEELRVGAEMKLAHQGRILFHSSCTIVEVPRFDESFVDFVAMCLAADPNERPSATELLKHDFLNENVASMADFQETLINEI